MRALDHGIETLGRRPVRKLDPPVRAALRIGAYQLAYLDRVAAHAAVNESVELVRAARLERAVPFTNAVMRRLAAGLRDLLDALPGRPAQALVPRLDRRDLAARLGRGGGARADARAERGAGDGRPARARRARGRADGRPGRLPRRPSRRAGARRGADLAAEPRLAARRARRRLASRGAHARPLRRPRREGDDARAARSSRSSCTRAARASSRRTSAGSARRTSASSTRTRSRCPPELTGFDRALVDAPVLRARRARRAARPPLARRSRCPSSSSSCCARRPSASGRAGRSSTRSAR